MAKRVFKSQLRPCNCICHSDIDMLVTKPGHLFYYGKKSI
nr:MAG TPA: hypothetical protein [Microviridae sp.]